LVCQLRKQRSRFRIICSYWSMIKAKWSAAIGDDPFGHNDKTDSDATVQANLEKMAADAQTAGVNPILVSLPHACRLPSR